jgi:hypothetical protein
LPKKKKETSLRTDEAAWCTVRAVLTLFVCKMKVVISFAVTNGDVLLLEYGYCTSTPRYLVKERNSDVLSRCWNDEWCFPPQESAVYCGEKTSIEILLNGNCRTVFFQKQGFIFLFDLVLSVEWKVAACLLSVMNLYARSLNVPCTKPLWGGRLLYGLTLSNRIVILTTRKNS